MEKNQQSSQYKCCDNIFSSQMEYDNHCCDRHNQENDF